MARIVIKPTRPKYKKTKRSKSTKSTNKRPKKPRPNRAGNSDQRKPVKSNPETSEEQCTITARHPRGHVIHKQKQIKFLGQPTFESDKASAEYRKGNLKKAIKIEIAYQKQLRSRRKKRYNQKRDWYMKTSDSRTHIDPYAGKVDYYCQNSKIPLDWDKEEWYIEYLWGKGEAQRWNNKGKGTWGFLCPYTPFRPLLIEEDEF